MPIEQLIQTVVILLLIGLGLVFLQKAKIDETIKFFINAIVIVAVVIWLLTSLLPALMATT